MDITPEKRHDLATEALQPIVAEVVAAQTCVAAAYASRARGERTIQLCHAEQRLQSATAKLRALMEWQ